MGNNKKKSDSGNFLVQGSILAAAGIIVRFIGLLYKIPMTRPSGMRESVITTPHTRSTTLD